MTDLSAFVPLVLPHVPGAPDVAALLAIRRAILEFCKRAPVWQSFKVADLIAHTSSYTVSPETNGVVHSIQAVKLNGMPLRPLQLVGLAAQGLGTGEATPTGYYVSAPGVVTLCPTPDVGGVGALAFFCTNIPTATCTAIPDFMFNNYCQTVIDGALAYLLSTPNKAWFQADLAAWYQSVFNSGIATASMDAAQGFGRTPLRTKVWV